MGEKTNTLVGVGLILLKVALTLAGIGVAIWGLVTGNWSLAGIGLALVLGGQVVQVIDVWHLDRLLHKWAVDAVMGIGPVPPRSVRLQLMRWVTQHAGGRDRSEGFKIACGAWAEEQENAAREGRPAEPIW